MKQINILKFCFAVILIQFLLINIIAAQTSKEYFKKGKQEAKEGNIEDAIDNYNMAIELDSNYIDAYLKRGIAYCSLKNYTEALIDYNRVIYLNNNYAEAYFRRGDLYRKIKNLKYAIEDYNTAIELDTNYKSKVHQYYEEYLEKGKELCNNGFSYEGSIYLDNAIAIVPNFAEAYFYRGQCANHLGQIRVEFENYNKVIELDTSYLEVYYYRGLIYSFWGQYEEAINDYTQAIELNTEYSEAYLKRGEILHFRLKRYEEAIKDYKKAMEFNPKLINELTNRISELENYISELENKISKENEDFIGFWVIDVGYIPYSDYPAAYLVIKENYFYDGVNYNGGSWSSKWEISEEGFLRLFFDWDDQVYTGIEYVDYKYENNKLILHSMKYYKYQEDDFLSHPYIIISPTVLVYKK